MTAFIKENFRNSNGYITYRAEFSDYKFVARFKSVCGTNGANTFMTFLRKNFTVEEYFAAIDAGESPLNIAQAKGYLLPHVKRTLKEQGYEVSVAGFDQYIKDRVAAHAA